MTKLVMMKYTCPFCGTEHIIQIKLKELKKMMKAAKHPDLIAKENFEQWKYETH